MLREILIIAKPEVLQDFGERQIAPNESHMQIEACNFWTSLLQMARVSIYSYGMSPVDQDYSSGLRKIGVRLVAGELSESTSSLRRRRNLNGDWSDSQTCSIVYRTRFSGPQRRPGG